MNDSVLEIELQPKQIQFKEAIDIYPIVGYGGARGGGKSHGLRNIHLIRRIQYEKSKGVIFRKTYPELEANHIRPLFDQFPGLREYYNESKKLLTLPNGSTEQFAHCGSVKDVYLYQGREFDDFAYEEAGEIEEEVFDLLHASNRSSDPNIPARSQLTFNPGGLGHGWLKRRFISRNFKSGENPQDYFFIKALIDDNPALMQADPKYKERLKSIKNNQLRRAWLDGDWDIEAGQFFSELSNKIHVVEPFPIPSHWAWFCSYDYGFGHPAAFLFFVSDEQGNVYLVHEIIQAGMHIDTTKKKAHDFLNQMEQSGEKRSSNPIIWAGHDCFAKGRSGDPSIAEDFAKPPYSLFLKRANVNRKLGASQIRSYLRYTIDDNNKQIGPKVKIFANCKITFDCLSRMTHNPNDIEDVLKVDSVSGDVWQGDDAYDAFRMGLMSRPVISILPKKPIMTSYDDPDPHLGNPSWQTV